MLCEIGVYIGARLVRSVHLYECAVMHSQTVLEDQSTLTTHGRVRKSTG